MALVITFIIIFSYNYVLLFTVHKTHIHDLMNPGSPRRPIKQSLLHTFYR